MRAASACALDDRTRRRPRRASWGKSWGKSAALRIYPSDYKSLLMCGGGDAEPTGRAARLEPSSHHRSSWSRRACTARPGLDEHVLHGKAELGFCESETGLKLGVSGSG